jgi:hypothetical protein
LADVDDVGVDEVHAAGLEGVAAGFEDDRVFGRVAEFACGDAGERVPSLDDIRVAAPC